MILAERRDCKDHISIFSTENWSLIKHFELETDDLCGLSCSPLGSTFCVWESPLEYKILVYNIDGECISRFQPKEWTLGVRLVSWPSSGQLLTIGSYDQKIRLLNYITYKMIMEFEHPTKISSQDLVIFKEIDGRKEVSMDETSEEISIYSSPSKCNFFYNYF
jgi:WD40 repeat protein